jgi:Mg-chelatase subunit ChlD
VRVTCGTVRRVSLASVAALVLAVCAWAAEPAVRAGAATSIKDPAVRQKAVDQLVEHYLEMYGKHLKSRDWMARAMAVIGLARVDDPRITDRLFEVLDGDKLPLVRVYAWEAVHSRLGSLNEEQRGRWVRTGKTLLAKGLLRGDLRVGLIRAVAPAGPTDANRQLFRGLFEKTNSMDSSDMRTLAAMREVLSQWRDRALIADLVGTMGQLDCVFRAEYLLADLPWAVREKSRSFANEGTEVLCSKVQDLWMKALKGARENRFKPERIDPYNGPSLVIPAAEKVADPGDARWRKDLELTRFTLDHLDVTLAVDSTGSMMPVIRFVQRDLAKLMRAFYLISYEPRLGIVFYRDHGDAYVVKPFPLTSNAKALSQAIRDIDAKGGADLPEAVYEALLVALTKQKWSSGHYARRIVVVMGDAPPHENTMEKIEKMVTAAAEKNFRVFCVKVRGRYTAGDMSAFDRIAEWGKGKSLWAEFRDERFLLFESLDVAGRDLRTRKALAREVLPEFWQVASPPPSDDPYRKLVREIVRTAIPKSYEDKTDPFVDTLLEYLEMHVPERRQPVAPLEDKKDDSKRIKKPDWRAGRETFDPQKR